MRKDKEMPPDTVKIITMLRIDDNTVVDSEELTSEQKEAYIEFAIHLAAPKIAGILAGHTNPIEEQKVMNA